MIEYPDLEIRNEDELAAQAIARTSGGLTLEIVNAQIRDRQEILKLLDAGLDAPVCPELTNANPSAPHTVLLEAFAWLLAQQAYRLNRVPEQNFVAFANLFGIEPRPATFAETILRFTVDAPINTTVNIPAETQVSDADGNYVFETISDLSIPSGQMTGEVTARCSVAGQILLSSNILTELIDPIAFVEMVTNPSAIDSGTNFESLESTLNRVKRYQRRGERLVSTKDLEEAILDEALEGNGIVRVFPFIKNGEFFDINGQTTPIPGHTTVIVGTKIGGNIDDLMRLKVASLLEQSVGNQFIYIVDPIFIGFDVEVKIRLKTGSPQGTVVGAIENNLRNFYAPAREQFGRPIFRSEIIAVIEGTAGVDRIETQQNTQILATPETDIRLAEYQLARLDEVIISVV